MTGPPHSGIDLHKVRTTLIALTLLRQSLLSGLNVDQDLLSAYARYKTAYFATENSSSSVMSLNITVQ